MCGKSEAEAQAEADKKIASVNKIAEAEKNQVWVDITATATR
jgi:hypothetical protein